MDFLQDLIQTSNNTVNNEDVQIEYVINSKYYLIPEYKKSVNRFLRNHQKKKNNCSNYNVTSSDNDICDIFIQQLISK